jgi:hypothetical protein
VAKFPKKSEAVQKFQKWKSNTGNLILGVIWYRTRRCQASGEGNENNVTRVLLPPVVEPQWSVGTWVREPTEMAGNMRSGTPEKL